MGAELLIFDLFLIFAGAAVLATAALFARQALVVAYIVVGLLLGPSGLNLVSNSGNIERISEIGIAFLLFLLGLNLHPQKLLQLFRSTVLVTLVSSLVFGGVGFFGATLLGLPWGESLIVGVAMTFSSTILGLKLLPTTVLHHQHTGEVMISILLMQDIIAIVCLLFINTQGASAELGSRALWMIGGLPLLVLVALLLERYVIQWLFRHFDTIQEYLFLVAIAWCLGIAELAAHVGLSLEIGAFVAGVAIAAHPVSTFIAESLKPLRDFFLILFFFALGAGANLREMGDVLLPALTLAAVMLVLKPLVFRQLLVRTGETSGRALEIGTRLGQLSEFSLLISVLAANAGLLSPRGAYLIQAATLASFLVSPYLTILRYPSPIAVSATLRRD